MKKFLLCGLVVVLLLVSCGAVFAADTLKIGYLAALTGDWAAYGQTEEKAARKGSRGARITMSI